MKRNINSRGEGCCVQRSIGHAADWQYVEGLVDFAEWVRSKGLPGGAVPFLVDQRIPACCRDRGKPIPDYLQIEGIDLELLRLATSCGLMASTTYSTSATGRYEGRRISHMVNTLHAKKDFGILDNNYIGEDNIEWLSESEFVQTFSPGWCVLLLTKGQVSYQQAADEWEWRPLERSFWGLFHGDRQMGAWSPRAGYHPLRHNGTWGTPINLSDAEDQGCPYKGQGKASYTRSGKAISRDETKVAIEQCRPAPAPRPPPIPPPAPAPEPAPLQPAPAPAPLPAPVSPSPGPGVPAVAAGGFDVFHLLFPLLTFAGTLGYGWLTRWMQQPASPNPTAGLVDLLGKLHDKLTPPAPKA